MCSTQLNFWGIKQVAPEFELYQHMVEFEQDSTTTTTTYKRLACKPFTSRLPSLSRGAMSTKKAKASTEKARSEEASKKEKSAPVRAEKTKAAVTKQAKTGDDDVEDERFRTVRTDPRFRMPKSSSGEKGAGKKIVVDERFSAMFTDDEFKSSRAKIDKYGRKVKSKDQGNDLSRHYVLSTAEKERLEHLNRIARGESEEMSSSSSESSDDEDAEIEEEDALQDQPLLAAELGIDTSKRLAVIGCDWDHIRAVDVFAMLKSFTPPGGAVISVAVYSSEFGRKRMQNEELNGPFHNDEKKEEDDVISDDERNHEAGSGYDPELLRKYGKERLLYYFAVVTCDSVATAEALYRECDGVEFEHSSVTLDLRFVPDDVTFDPSTLRDRADDIPESYAPANFVNKSLQQTEVDLAWDEPAYDRRKLMRWGAFGGGKKKAEEAIPVEELEAFIASEDEGDDSDDEREKRQQDVERYRALLGVGPRKNADEAKEEDEEDGFFVKEDESAEDGSGTSEDEEEDDEKPSKTKAGKASRYANSKLFTEESQVDEEDDKPKKKGLSKKEKRKLKKQAKKGLADDDDNGDVGVDVEDDRFAPLFNEPDFALDRTDPRFKLTKTVKKIEEERRKRLRSILKE